MDSSGKFCSICCYFCLKIEIETWSQLTAAAPWTPRGWMGAVTFNALTNADYTLGDKIWVLGGSTIGKGVETMVASTDAWFTRDGGTASFFKFFLY